MIGSYSDPHQLTSFWRPPGIQGGFRERIEPLDFYGKKRVYLAVKSLIPHCNQDNTKPNHPRPLLCKEGSFKSPSYFTRITSKTSFSFSSSSVPELASMRN